MDSIYCYRNDAIVFDELYFSAIVRAESIKCRYCVQCAKTLRRPENGGRRSRAGRVVFFFLSII